MPKITRRPKIRCPHCGSSQAYIRLKTGQIVCPECGQISAKKGELSHGSRHPAVDPESL